MDDCPLDISTLPSPHLHPHIDGPRSPKDLQAAVIDLRSEAASLVDMVSPAEKAELLASLQNLPTKQLEAAIAFLASRHPLVLQQQEETSLDHQVRKIYKRMLEALSWMNYLKLRTYIYLVVKHCLDHLFICKSAVGAAVVICRCPLIIILLLAPPLRLIRPPLMLRIACPRCRLSSTDTMLFYSGSCST